MSRIIDGKAIAAASLDRTASSAALLRERNITPTLAVVVPTDDEGAAWYVRSIARTAAKAGIDCQVHKLPLPTGRSEIANRLSELSREPAVHGIICQTPLPEGVDLPAVGASIPAASDVDGASPQSLGMVTAGVAGAFPPATAAICHSRTQDLPAVCRDADVLVAAIGRPRMIGADYVRPGAVVIDVGTSPTEGGGLAGDVDTEALMGLASAITPVPGGVGPVTTAQLMWHTVRAARAASEQPQQQARTHRSGP